MTSTFGLSAQQTLFRFVAYRAVPTYVFAATAFVTVDRIGAPVWISAIVLWTCSIAATHGRVVLDGLLKRRGEVNYASYHVVMIILLTAAVGIAMLTASLWGLLVPPPAELLSALWSGLLVAGLGGFALTILVPRDPNAPTYGPAYMIDRAEREVGIELFDWLHAECIRTRCDPIFLKALLVVEAVQRPRWLRRIEHVGARLRIAKTSGVMQMTSRRPLSDRESVTAAAEAYAGTWTLAFTGGYGPGLLESDLGKAWAVSTRHNGDGEFAESVSDVASWLLHSSPMLHAIESPSEGQLLELRRYPERFALRGVARSAVLQVIQESSSFSQKRERLSRPGESPPDEWWAWECDIDPAAEKVWVFDLLTRVGTMLRLGEGEVQGSFRFDYGSTEGDSTEEGPTPNDIERKRRAWSLLRDSLTTLGEAYRAGFAVHVSARRGKKSV